MKGHYERKGHLKPCRGKSIFLIVALSLLGIAILVSAFGFAYYNSTLNKLNHVAVPKIEYTSSTEEFAYTEDLFETTIPTQPSIEQIMESEPHIASSEDYINFLVVGQAARDGEPERFADTMILCTVNTYEKTLTLTSMLRDSFVQMPDYRNHTGGRIKLTTIYHLGYIFGDGIAGSMELMNLTLYKNFGIEVDHNIEVDFNAFIRVIDALGGVDVELTEAEAQYLNDSGMFEELQPGSAHLSGSLALHYARMRKAGPGDNDINRTSRQRQLIASVVEKLKQLSVSDLNSLANEILPLVSTSMDNSGITKMLVTLLPLLPELRIESGGTCPAEYYGDMVEIYSDGVIHSVLRFNEAETKKAMRAITEGENQ